MTYNVFGGTLNLAQLNSVLCETCYCGHNGALCVYILNQHDSNSLYGFVILEYSFGRLQ